MFVQILDSVSLRYRDSTSEFDAEIGGVAI